jgi:sugar phosphate isomerase/epimerase
MRAVALQAGGFGNIIWSATSIFDLSLEGRAAVHAGIATIALRNYDVFTALDIAAQAGFAGVEIWGKPPHIPEGVDEEHIRRIRDRACANGIKIPIFGSYVNPSWPEYEAKSDEAIKIALRLGAKIIRVWAGNKEPDAAEQDLWEHVAGSLREFALRAEYEGLQLAIEMHSDTLCYTAKGAKRVLEMADAPSLKLNYQVGDFANPDVDNDISLVGDQIIMGHAQNFVASTYKPGSLVRSLVRDGNVDYDRVLSLLSERGFNGYVEVEFVKDEEISEDAMMESLKNDAQYLIELTKRYSKG